MHRFPVQTALTIAIFGAAMAAIAGLARHPQPPPAETNLPPIVFREPPVVPQLLDDSHASLDRFYAALWRTERKESITRIVHYGDSPTTADLITGDTRAILQARYGDAGHGFVLIAKPWAWYGHRDVSLSGSGWKVVTERDGLMGLGGISFTGTSSSRASIQFADRGQSLFELWFLKQPNGGAVTLTADGVVAARIDTSGDEKSPGFAAFTVTASELELRPEGNVRVYGLTAEKPGPGVVYDSLGLNGASITVLSHAFNERHWAEELRHRNPNLVVINYGTNEADFVDFVNHQYEKELRIAIARIRAAVPEASILVMSPMDRGHRTGPGEIETMDTIPRIVAIQRRVALDTGCGFFDTFDAMGGAGTMARWYAAQPRLVSADFIHPYPAGGKLIAAILAKKIDAGLAHFKLRLHLNDASK